MIIEVSSPSAEAIDRRERLLAYRRLRSLKEYVLVLQDDRRIEVHRRGSADEWFTESVGPEGTIQLGSMGLALSVNDICEDVI